MEFYSKANEKLLKGSKQENDMIWFLFSKISLIPVKRTVGGKKSQHRRYLRGLSKEMLVLSTVMVATETEINRVKTRMRDQGHRFGDSLDVRVDGSAELGYLIFHLKTGWLMISFNDMRAIPKRNKFVQKKVCKKKRKKLRDGYD